MGTREKLHVSSKAQSTLPKIQLVEGWGKNANPSSGVVRGATNQPWWWGSGENTIPSSGKVGAIQIHLLEKGSTKNPL